MTAPRTSPSAVLQCPSGAPQPSDHLRRRAPPVAFEASEVEGSIPDRFARVVRERRKALAVRGPVHEWTYEELDHRANQIARAILDVDGASSSPIPLLIPLLIPLGAPAIAAILGVLKTGRAYAPLDLHDPAARHRSIFTDLGATVVISDGNPGLSSDASGGPRLIDLRALPDARRSSASAPTISPDAIAYILFTSGSTGKPKGVTQSHRNVVHDIRRQSIDLRTSTEDRCGLLFAPSSSASVCHIFGALLTGAACCTYDLHTRGVGPLAGWLRDNKISICDINVSTFRLFAAGLSDADAFPDMRVFAPGSEPLYRADVETFQKHFAPPCVLQNALGTTESRTVTQRFYGVESKLSEWAVPVGKPVDGCDVLVLDEAGEVVATGETGEIVLRSRYLSPGYWAKPEESARAFRLVESDRLLRSYATGDLGHWDDNGDLVHDGRKDFQVKIRGYRVDTSAVEAALLRGDDVRDAAVLARADDRGRTRLVAYVEPRDDTSPQPEALRASLAASLPPAMIPSAFYAVDQLPKTRNDKLDRTALIAGVTARPLLNADAAGARDDIEERLLDVWRTVLGQANIGITDRFTDLGGDSLDALEIFAAIDTWYGHRLPLISIDRSGTIRELAALLRGQLDGDGTRWKHLTPLQPDGTRPPLFLTHSIYGTLLGYLPLVRHLSDQQPVFGFQPAADEEFEPGTTTIEGLAARYVEEMLASHPDGPYRVGGFSFGGMVAFEIAHQLRASGRAVELLAIIDTLPNFDRQAARFQRPGDMWHFARNVPGWLRYKLHEQRSRRTVSLTGDADHTARRVFGTGSPIALSEVVRRRERAFLEAIERYDIQRYDGDAVLFRASVRPLRHSFTPDGGWRQFIGGDLRVEEIPGTHDTIITEPNVGALADRMSRELNGAAAN